MPANTTVLVITLRGRTTPQAAQAGSHAFAEAYLRNREETARAGLDQQIKTLDAKVKQLTAALTGINARLADARPDSSERPNLESLRSNSQNQLNTLTGRLNELTTTTVSAGSIISDARLPERADQPERAAQPRHRRDGSACCSGWRWRSLRERLDRRLRDRGGRPRPRPDRPVLAALDERTAPQLRRRAPAVRAGGRIFNRLRNEVLASLQPGRPDHRGDRRQPRLGVARWSPPTWPPRWPAPAATSC